MINWTDADQRIRTHTAMAERVNVLGWMRQIPAALRGASRSGSGTHLGRGLVMAIQRGRIMLSSAAKLLALPNH